MHYNYSNYSSLREYRPGQTSYSASKSTRRGLRWALVGITAGIAIGLFGFNAYDANALKIKELSLDIPQTTTNQDEYAVAPISIDRSNNASSSAVVDQNTQAGSWHEVTVKSGDSLAKIFSRQKLPPKQLHEILSGGGLATKLKRIYPGQTLRLRTSSEDGLHELLYKLDAMNEVQILQSDSGFTSQLITRIPERRVTHASATIKNSLFLAAKKANLPDNITMEVAGIFGWDIDFALDIRSGDEFSVIYEALFLDGEPIGTGNILAAEFTNNKKQFQAVRYTDKKGHSDYYARDGRSMRKTFLRTPVSFTRISSRFSKGRKHPILNRIRAHHGVDYAAPRGTPVKSTGAGKIVLRGNKGGYGKTVVVQHGSRYSTLYAHLSRYARGLKNGSRVQQGQVIGYIGSSGLATGPHLHYEFRVNGTHRNPLTVKFPSAAPLAKQYRNDFNNVSQNLLSQLETTKNQTIALQNK